MTTTTTAFDPFRTPDFSDLHETMKRARDDDPVFFAEDLHMWVVTRYDDALEVLRDHERFSSSTRAVILSQFVDEARTILGRTATFAAPNMGFDGPPDHERLRRPVARYLSAKAVAEMAPRLEAIAADRLARLPDAPVVDVMGGFARPFADAVILDLVGVPESDRERVLRYHESSNAFFFGAPAPDVQVAYAHDVVAFEAYLADLVAERRRRPQDDLTSRLVGLMATGEAEWTEEELIGLLAFDLITAGIRPIAFSLVTLVRQLLEDGRRGWDRLVADPGAFDHAFAESLRRRGLSLGVYRQATTDVEVAGVTIPAGGVVWVMVCSAGRDEAQFPEPESFDVDRDNLGSSLHFSHGVHYCLGSSLARATARVGLDALMARFPRMSAVEGQQLTFEPSYNLMVPTQFLVQTG